MSPIHITAAATTISDRDILPWLLTTEGLLFAALSVSVSLSGNSTFGPKTVVSPAALAFVAAGVLTTVAAAAALAWVGSFTGPHWPSELTTQVEALALLFAIVVQPAIALVLALGIWRG